MKENVARIKFCPLSRENGSNRAPDGNILRSSMCLGSDCMAWRWEGQEVDIARGTVSEEILNVFTPVPPSGRGWVTDAEQYLTKNSKPWFKRPWPEGERPGFCGAFEPKVAEINQ